MGGEIGGGVREVEGKEGSGGGRWRGREVRGERWRGREVEGEGGEG